MQAQQALPVVSLLRAQFAQLATALTRQILARSAAQESSRRVTRRVRASHALLATRARPVQPTVPHVLLAPTPQTRIRLMEPLAMHARQAFTATTECVHHVQTDPLQLMVPPLALQVQISHATL